VHRKIIYLINPVSGTKKKDPLIAFVKKETEKNQIPCSFYDTNVTGEYQWLSEKIAAEKITDIVIIGGDGTINPIVAAIGSLDINIGILPSGSGNGLAYSANIPKDYKKAIRIIFKGKTEPTDAFMVNDRFACMLSGIGFDAQVAYDFAKQEKRGLVNYTKQSLMNFFKANPYPFEITLDDCSFYIEAFFISIANSNQFGNNFKIAPKASIRDGLLDIVIVQKMSKLKLPFAIINQLRGGNKFKTIFEDLQKKNIIYFQTAAITIKNLRLAPVHIDGDPVKSTDHFEFRILKDHFRLLVP
jgi:YegS/Rv2252/BmrU family lipid kinase